MAYVSKNHTAFLVHFGLVVVVNVELGEENLVFVASIGALQIIYQLYMKLVGHVWC